MMKYERMDAADASLVMLSEIHRNAKIITTDRRDFTLYRRFGRQRLPVILPPERAPLVIQRERLFGCSIPREVACGESGQPRNAKLVEM